MGRNGKFGDEATTRHSGGPLATQVSNDCQALKSGPTPTAAGVAALNLGQAARPRAMIPWILSSLANPGTSESISAVLQLSTTTGAPHQAQAQARGIRGSRIIRILRWIRRAYRLWCVEAGITLAASSMWATGSLGPTPPALFAANSHDKGWPYLWRFQTRKDAGRAPCQ